MMPESCGLFGIMRQNDRAKCPIQENRVPLYLFVFAAFIQRQVIPLGCKMP
jgi:hypothetical protein